MEGTNIILGIQWLETLQKIKTNHKELQMEFDQNGVIVNLQGDPHLSKSAISGSNFHKLVSWQEIAYFCHMVCEPSKSLVEGQLAIQKVIENSRWFSKTQSACPQLV